MRISSTRLAISGRDGPPDAGRVVWRDCAAVGQEPAGVVEEDDAVAQQAPPLLGVEGDGVGRVTVRAVSWRARGPVRTHGEPLDQELRTYVDCGPLLARSRAVLVTAPAKTAGAGRCQLQPEPGWRRRGRVRAGVVPPLRDAKRAECLHNRDAEIAGGHQGGSPLVQLTACTTSGRSRRQRARSGSPNAGTRASSSASPRLRPCRPGYARRAGRRRVRRDPARPADASARPRSPCAPAGRGYG